MVWASAGETWHRVEIVCPGCGKAAAFRRASALQLRDGDLAARAAGLRDLTLVGGADEIPQALYRHGLGARPIEALSELTEPERETLRLNAPWPPRHDEGSCLCDACGRRRAHRLAWPADAYFQIEHKGHTLWAWNRHLAEVLAAYVAAPDAKAYRAASPHEAFLKRVPTPFLTAQNRDAVLKKLRRKIEEVTA